MPPKKTTAANGSNGSDTDGNTNQCRRTGAARHYSFTLSNYTEEDIAILVDFFSNGSKQYIFQEEICPTTGTPHLQGSVAFSAKLRPIETIKIPRIHWEKTKNISSSFLYCCKSTSRKENGRLWRKNVAPPMGILEVKDFYPWQLDIWNMIETIPDDRSIYWYWEHNGNRGKSALVKSICFHKNALVISGKGENIKFGIVAWHKSKHTYPEIIILDIPRSMLDYVSYTAIEEVKNGCFFSGKYESSMVLMACPHIICFANEAPETDKMSLDRWKIIEL